MIRCVRRGCSRLDTECVGCVLCGGSPSIRAEQCHVSTKTKIKLGTRLDVLKRFGVRVNIERSLAKVMGARNTFVVVLELADSPPRRRSS